MGEEDVVFTSFLLLQTKGIIQRASSIFRVRQGGGLLSRHDQYCCHVTHVLRRGGKRADDRMKSQNPAPLPFLLHV